MTTEHVLTPDDRCPCGEPQEGSGYCSYECYSKHDEYATSPAPMGELPSEADRLAEIRARIDAATPGPWIYESQADVHGFDGDEIHYVTPQDAARDDDPPMTSFYERADAELVAHAPDDLAYLLGELDDAQRLFDALGSEAAEELKAAHAALTKLRARVGVLEGQLATAREEATELGAKLKDFLDGQFRISKVIGETEDKFEQQRLLGLAEARATLRAALDGCDDFMVPTIRACTGCGKCSYCAARGITAASVLGLDGGGSDAE